MNDKYDINSTIEEINNLLIENSIDTEKRNNYLCNLRDLSHKLLIICGLSGVGKDTIADELVKYNSKYKYHIPITTRNERNGESNVRYYFESVQNFIDKCKNGDFLFWHYNGLETNGQPKYYGVTYLDLYKDLVNNDLVIITDDVLGTKFFKSTFPKCMVILVKPENTEQLEKQIMSRGEQYVMEFKKRTEYILNFSIDSSLIDYELINEYNNLSNTLNKIIGFINSKSNDE